MRDPTRGSNRFWAAYTVVVLCVSVAAISPFTIWALFVMNADTQGHSAVDLPGSVGLLFKAIAFTTLVTLPTPIILGIRENWIIYRRLQEK